MNVAGMRHRLDSRRRLAAPPVPESPLAPPVETFDPQVEPDAADAAPVELDPADEGGAT